MKNYSAIVRELKSYANPEKAKILSRFFKTGKGEYGEGDIFLGVVIPHARKLIKDYLDSDFDDIEKLLNSKIHEYRMIALLILVKKYEKSKSDDEKKKIFNLYLKNTKNINNWDLVDLTAPNIVGSYLFDKDRKILYKLAKSNNLWEKRIAILSCFYFIKNKEHKDTFAICEILLHDKHDLIHKATGWMLREVGKRIDRKIEEIFLQKFYRVMPRTMLRYSIEHFDAKKRAFYMKK